MNSTHKNEKYLKKKEFNVNLHFSFIPFISVLLWFFYAHIAHTVPCWNYSLTKFSLCFCSKWAHSSNCKNDTIKVKFQWMTHYIVYQKELGRIGEIFYYNFSICDLFQPKRQTSAPSSGALLKNCKSHCYFRVIRVENSTERQRTIFGHVFPYEIADFCTKISQFFLPNNWPSMNHCVLFLWLFNIPIWFTWVQFLIWNESL